MAAGAAQLSFDALGTPLFATTFVVIDLETTGLSPGHDRITEIGAVRVRGGEVGGELQTLVHPGRAIPAAVSSVTGITDAMVAGHPPIEAVLPTLLEFLGDDVLVAHNARFDTSFLGAALARHGYPQLGNRVVDTARLARRVVRDEVRDLRLATLARHLRARTAPTHRALTDARATVDVLHGLLERAGSLGATTLEDLVDYTRSTSDRAFRKVALVRGAPDVAGVYRFLDARDEVLYVGKATSLRRRLRTYFGQDPRRRIADLVRETERVAWDPTPTVLEAEVRELRDIQRLRPRYNRQGRRPERQVHVKLTVEPFPRLSVVAAPRDDAALYCGPLPSRRVAEQLVDAIHDVIPIRQCTGRLRVAQDHGACVLKDLGRCGAPCDGTQSRADYSRVVARVAALLEGDATDVLGALRDRMTALARAGRFERATTARRRLHAAAGAMNATRRVARLAGVRELCAARTTPAGAELALLREGRLVATAVSPHAPSPEQARAVLAGCAPLEAPEDPHRGQVEEVALLETWLAAPGTRVLWADGAWADVWPAGTTLAETVDESRRLARALRRDRQDLERTKVVRRSAPGAA